MEVPPYSVCFMCLYRIRDGFGEGDPDGCLLSMGTPSGPGVVEPFSRVMVPGLGRLAAWGRESSEKVRKWYCEEQH